MIRFEDLSHLTGGTPLARFNLGFSKSFWSRTASALCSLEKKFEKHFGSPDPKSPYKGISWYWSKVNLLTLECEEFEKIRHAIFHCLDVYQDNFKIEKRMTLFKSWANIYSRGSEVLFHAHKSGAIVGLIHVSGTPTLDTGNTSYFFPLKEYGGMKRMVTLPFRPGCFYLHPGHIEHAMAPYRGKGRRISLPIDFQHEKTHEVFLPIQQWRGTRTD